MELTDAIYILLGFLVFIILFDLIVWKPNSLKRESEKLKKELKKANKPIQKKWRYQKGIVMKTESPIFFDTLFSIFCLRRVGCNLPIYVVGDLDDKQRGILKSVKNLKYEEGYYSQASAVIYSPFKEIIYVNPGTIFFYNPEHLFNENEYKSTGTIFWRSPKKQIWSSGLQNLIRTLIVYQVDNNPILTKSGGHCCDSRVMVINKEAHKIGLHKLIYLENSEAFSNDLSECFWISFELANEPYYFVEDPKKSVGGDLFLDSYKSPCWIQVDPNNPESLDIKSYSNFSDTPINYFKKTFNDEHNTKLETDLNKEQMWLLNEYRKIIHDLE